MDNPEDFEDFYIDKERMVTVEVEGVSLKVCCTADFRGLPNFDLRPRDRCFWDISDTTNWIKRNFVGKNGKIGKIGKIAK